MRAVCMLCGLLLIAVSCAATAAVTHGDLMLSGGKPFRLQFHGPKGQLKATVQLKVCKHVWGRSVSQDGRYAAIGCSFNPPGRNGTEAPPATQGSYYERRGDPIKVVLLQLTGSSPKVLGAKLLQGYNNATSVVTKTGCFYADSSDGTTPDTSPLALRSKILPRGAGAVLEIFLSIRCLPATPLCADLSTEYGPSAVQLWTVTHKQFETVGPLVAGGRAAFRDNNVKCGSQGFSVAVAASSNKVYATFGLDIATLEPINTIGVYEVLRDPKGGVRLVPTWKLKVDPTLALLNFLPTGPSTGCGISEVSTPTSDYQGLKVFSYAKSRAPYIGGISTADLRHEYADISCRGDVVYATMLTSKAARVLKVSTGLLRKGATGNVVFNASSDLTGISIIP